MTEDYFVRDTRIREARRERRKNFFDNLKIVLAFGGAFLVSGGLFYAMDQNINARKAREDREEARMAQVANTICGRAPFRVEVNSWKPWKVRCRDGRLFILDQEAVRMGLLPVSR